MRASAIRQAAGAAIGRKFRVTIRRRWVGLGLLAAIIASGGWWLNHWWTSWPARVVLQTQGMSWEDDGKQARAGRLPGVSWPEAFSPDGTLLAISEPGSLTLWDSAVGRKRATWAIPDGRRAYLGAFSPDGQTFGALSWGGGGQSLVLDLIDVASGHVRASLPTSGGGLVHGGLAFTNGGQNLRAFVYDKSDLIVLDCDVTPGRVVSSRTLSWSSSQNTTDVSSAGRLLALAPYLTAPGVSHLHTTDVTLWDVDQDREIARLSGSAEVLEVAFSPDAVALAIGRAGGSVEIWDLKTRRLRATFRPHNGSFDPRRLQFAPDGSALASLGDFTREAMTTVAVRRRVALLRGDRNWQPPRELVILDTATGRRLLRTEDECNPSFSPDNRTLATSHRDGAIRLRDLPGR